MSQLYSQWLFSILDTEDAETKVALEFMSSFDKLEYRNANITLRYARYWCQLSKHLYARKEEQLVSEKVQMLFEVPEKKLRTDVYWFEVLRACDLLSAVTMENLVQELQIRASIQNNNEGYAEVALQLDKATMAANLEHVKLAIGVCQYTLKTALLRCTCMREFAPEAVERVTRRYHGLRAIGCWLQGMYQLTVVHNPKTAGDWFETSRDIAAKHATPDCVAPVVLSAGMLILYGLVTKALSDNERGLAQAYLQYSKEPKKNNALLQKLQVLAKTPAGAPKPAIPEEGSVLLISSFTITENALENGISPLENAPFKKRK